MTLPRRAPGLLAVLVLASAVVALSCDSPMMRFLAWVCAPDRLERVGTHEVDADGLDTPVKIWFDAHAVPHIQAPDEASLSYALGYLHGRDRRFQLELFRLAGSGRLRELVGDADETGVLKNLEVFGRAVGFEHLGTDYLSSAPAGDRALLEAYSSGINGATAAEPVPLEFKLLEYQPKPWTANDTAMVMSMMSFGLCKNWQLELGRLELMAHQMRSGSTIERALQIWSPRSELPPFLVGEKPAKDPFADIAIVAPELLVYLQEWAEAAGAVAPGEGDGAGAIPRSGGPVDAAGRGGSRSNNWAMSGAWTGSGKAALSSDPHMIHAMPPMGYLVHAHCGASPTGPYEIIGAGFVGLPVLPFATNGKVAWGVTANWGDVTDLYVERVAPDRPDHYLFEGREVPFEVRDEVFKIRRDDGTFATETRRIRRTRHGVVVNDFVDRLPAGFPILALKWSWGGGALSAMQGLYRADSVREARESLLGFDAMVAHFALADHHGDIAYAGTMRLPRRTRHLGTLPVPGWTGTYEWQGTIPARELPFIENPPGGYFGTANNMLVQPESMGYPLNFDGDVAHRYRRIMQVLGAGRGDKTPTEVIAGLQMDGVDWGHRQVLAVTRAPLEALRDDAGGVVAQAARAYLEWDGEASPDSVGVTVEQSLHAMLVQRLLADEMRPRTAEFVLTFYNIEPLVYSMLTDPSNPAWDDRRTEAREQPAAVVTEVFRATVAALRARYGDDVSTWTWKRAAPFVLMHPFGTMKALAPALNRGPLPTQGTGNTVFKHQFMRSELIHFPVKYGPVLRVNIDLADLAGSRMSVPGGQSGRPASKHYADLLPMYMTGGGVSMRMGFDDIAARSIGVLTLR